MGMRQLLDQTMDLKRRLSTIMKTSKLSQTYFSHSDTVVFTFTSLYELRV